MGPATTYRSHRLQLIAIVALFVSLIALANAHTGSNHGHRVAHARLHGGHVHKRAQDEVPGFFSAPDNSLNGQLLRRDGVGGQTGGSGTSASNNDYTCGPGKPCSNNACCGESGWCGYNSTYCGDGCQSNCDAKAECGKYAAKPGQKCPVNVCCSEFGFCGTTEEFCKAGCQSNCEQPKPTGGPSDTQSRIVAYYEGWNTQHSCGTMEIEEIPVQQLTHLIAAFAYVTPGEFKVTNMDGVSTDLYERLPKLKSKNPNLKVMVALGGWTFNDPGPWQSVFPTLTSTSANRAKFIKNLLGFLDQYGFDGVDFDWEYPGAEDRGGSTSNGVDFTSMLKELRSAIDASAREYIVTFTAPTSYWYLRHFDITETTKHVDWINLMAYDLHGVWDRDNPIGSQVLAHTNLTEIDLALDLYWRNDIPPEKIVLGLGFYGRSFQLVDPKCYKPGCLFSGPGAEGPCTASAGILSYKEITDIIATTGAKPIHDSIAGVNYLVYGGNNWISYDDKKTYEAKIEYANLIGLGGLMIWAIDQDNSAHDALNAISKLSAGDLLQFDMDGGTSLAHSTDDLSSCKVTQCGEMCATGYTALTRVGVPGSGKNCKRDNFAYVCCPSFSAPDPKTCYWNLQTTGANLFERDCNGGCLEVGDVKVAGDSWGWVGSAFDGAAGPKCGRGGVTYCCPAGNKQQYLDICTWTECGGTCPDEKPFILTTDVGGSGHAQTNEACRPSKFDSYDRDAIGYEKRSLCCPSENSFNTETCAWHSKKECSEPCPDNQILLDSDVLGEDGRHSCSWGRTQKFCCDPPGGLSKPFTVANLDTLFPPEYLPSSDSIPVYDLVSFGGLYSAGGVEDPNASGVAFILFAGNQNLLTKMKKRENSKTGVEFLDCPSDVRLLPSTEPRTARVICLGDNIEECFSVQQGGTKGTLVSMPEECGDGFARAISLDLSKNQTLPIGIANKDPTSEVFDFVFDYDMANLKRDSGSLSMRVDYSNVGGYWDAVVKAPGITKRSLEDRYFSSSITDWANLYRNLGTPQGFAKQVARDFQDLIYFGHKQSCDIDGGKTIPEAIEVSSQGNIDLDVWYGYSMIGTIDDGHLNIHEANGFVDVAGNTDITFEISGVGNLDTSGRLSSSLIPTSLGGHTIMNDFITFNPFLTMGYKLGTTGPVEWNGYANARMVTSFGQGPVTFPSFADTRKSTKFDDKLESGKAGFKNTINADFTGSGNIGISHIVDAGLAVSMKLPSKVTGVGKFPTMSMNSESTVEFITDNRTVDGSVCLEVRMGKEQSQSYTSGTFVGWLDKGSNLLEGYVSKVSAPACFSKGSSSKRQGSSITDLYPAVDYVTGSGDLNADSIFKEYRPDNGMGINIDADLQIADSFSYLCMLARKDPLCCGCIDLDQLLGPDNRSGDGDYDGIFSAVDESFQKRQLFVDSDSKATSDFHPSNGTLDVPTEISLVSVLDDRSITPGNINYGPKKVTICNDKVAGPNYPAYPTNDRADKADWDTADDGHFQSVKRYDRVSEDCDNWDVHEIDTPRVTPAGDTAPYDTEHVYEGQSIGQFFNDYISKGRLPWWSAGYVPGGTPVDDARFGCDGIGNGGSWVTKWIKTRHDDTWDYTIERFTGGTTSKKGTFGKRVLEELGGMDKLDRLVVFAQRPNIDKGFLFGGKPPYTGDNYAGKSYQEQLLIMKELGMVFTYMELPEIIDAYCLTYEGIYTLMGQFDTWYAGQNPSGPVSGLQEKWVLYNRGLLDNVVVKAHEIATTWFSRVDKVNIPQFYQDIWTNVISTQANKMTLRNVHCANLPPTNIPDTTFLSSPWQPGA